MVGYIYKYENLINNKIYIGQTTDLSARKSSHRYKAAFVKSKFYNAVGKYGWENFKFSILSQVEASTVEEIQKSLDALEVQYIQEYNSFEKGYNSTGGGHCYRGKEVSEEFREFCRNRTYSAETREKMRIAATNKIVSEKTRQKCRENAIRRNFASYREATTEKRNAGIRRAKGKPVLQLGADGNIVKEFETLKDAVKYVKENYAQDRSLISIEHGIHRHCVGETKKKLYYGFEWKFKSYV